MLEKIPGAAKDSDAAKLRDRILNSDDYKKLSLYPPLKRVFDEVYGEAVLETDDIETLQSKKGAVRYLILAAKKLRKAILQGNAWELGPDDKPDYSSEESILAFMDKLVYSEDLDEDLQNITNISEDDILKIFDEDTVRTARDLFCNAELESLPKTNDEIIQAITDSGLYYCVEPSGIYEAKDMLLEEIENLKLRNFAAKRGVAWLRLAKLGIAGLAVSAAFLVTRIGIIPDAYDLAMLGASAGVSALYFFVG